MAALKICVANVLLIDKNVSKFNMFKQEVPNKQCNNGPSQRFIVVMAMK
jgi:hypothetical protein